MNVGHVTQKAAAVVAAAIGAQPAVQFQQGPKQGGLIQVHFGNTGTLTVQGRLDPNGVYVNLTAAITEAAGVDQIILLTNACPDMRVNVTANGTTIDVWIMA